MIRKAWLLEQLLLCVALLPLALLRAFGVVLGVAMYVFKVPAYHTTRRNLRHCFRELSDGEIRTLTREHLLHLAWTLTDFVASARKGAMRRRFQVRKMHGKETFDEALKTEPVLLLIPHIGFWEFAAVVLGKPYSTHILFSARQLGALNEFIRTNREEYGLTMYENTLVGLRGIVSALQPGKVVAVLPDQVPTRGRSVCSYFFGQPAQTTTLVHSLVGRSKSRVKVFVASFLRLTDGIDVYFDLVDSGIADDDVEKSVLCMNRAIEATVMRAPAQYQWEYKRFRRTGDVSIYD